jgi:hypothetical protein
MIEMETKHKSLTLKRGILAIVIMYACQLIVGFAGWNILA